MKKCFFIKTNGYIKVFILFIVLFLSSCKKETAKTVGSNFDTNTLFDIDGNKYSVVKIGEQSWMAENLRTTKYADGSLIPNETSYETWIDLESGAWCNYQNNDSIGERYGKLYNWYSVADPRKLCPLGWHVPSDTEWDQLVDYLGGFPIAGGKMKDTILWQSPNTGASNISGFSALPGGACINSSNQFYSLGTYGNWWSSSESTARFAWNRALGYETEGSGRNYFNKIAGFSVRCVKD
jgi:uncharacterized protein (TIGR02145 family)